MRNLHTASNYGHVAEVSCSEVDLVRLKELIVHTTYGAGGIWDFVISCMDFGIDWPKWWSIYQEQRARYFSALGTSVFLHKLTLNDSDFRKEAWRRYDLCVTLGIATSNEAHYPDLFEVTEFVKPGWLDDARISFPDKAFGRYVMACPPRGRLLDPDEPGAMNEVWAEHSDFFKANDLLAYGDDVPIEAIVPLAPNSYLRELLKRHDVKPAALRKANEKLLLETIHGDENEAAALRTKVVAPNLWCRMPPRDLSWDQLQAFRWQSRAMGGALADVFRL